MYMLVYNISFLHWEFCVSVRRSLEIAYRGLNCSLARAMDGRI